MHRFICSLFDRRHRSLWRRQVVAAFLTAVLLLQSATAVAPGPAWWGTQQALDEYAYPDDFAAANIGQLKYFATKAAAAMNAPVNQGGLEGGAGTAINDLITSWDSAPAPGVVRDDFQALNQGQLKNVAQLFYDRLGLPYPWTGGESLRDDYLWANVGQLKNVFSFALAFRTGGTAAAIPPATLASALAAWESLTTAPEGSTADDFDGDGIPNLQEYLMGNPLFDPLDIDGDRIPDLVEDLYPGILSKLRFADAVEDYDADGVMNFEEVLLDLDLTASTTTGRSDGLTDAEVLAWGLCIANAPLESSTDAAAAVWQQIDANWVDDHFGDPSWLDQTDANSDGEADGLTAFRSGYGSEIFYIADNIANPPTPYDLDGDEIPDPDRDYDSMPDLWEYRYAFNLRDAQDYTEDPDDDTLINHSEFLQHTNPRLSDSDGDGFGDWDEVTLGSDPAQQSSQPPFLLSMIGGTGQQVRAGEQSRPLVVRVTQLALPRQGVQITFTVASGTGLLQTGTAAASRGTQITVTTGADGVATATYIPAPSAGPGSAAITASLPEEASAIGTGSTSFSLAVVELTGVPAGGGNSPPAPWAEPGGGSSNSSGGDDGEDGMILEVSAKSYTMSAVNGNIVTPPNTRTYTTGEVLVGSWNLTSLAYYGFPDNVWTLPYDDNEGDLRSTIYDHFVSASFGESTQFMGPVQALPKLMRGQTVAASSDSVIVRTPGSWERHDDTGTAIKVELKGAEPGSLAAKNGASRTYFIIHRRQGLVFDRSTWYQLVGELQTVGVGQVTFSTGSETTPVKVNEGTLAPGIVKKVGNSIEIVPQRSSEETIDSITLLPVKLQTIAFKSGSVQNSFSIKSDDGATLYGDSGGPMGGQWLDNNGNMKTDLENGDRNWPVGFEIGAPVQVRACLSLPGLPKGTPVAVTAECPGKLKVEWNASSGSDGQIDLKYTTSTVPLPPKVQCYSHDSDNEAFKIDWKVKIASGDYISLGTSKHTLYVCVDYIGLSCEETLLYLACKGPSKGNFSTANLDLVRSVFAEFQDLKVCKVKPTTATPDDSAMQYNHTSAPVTGDYTKLLKNGKGRCGHWTDLLLNTLSCHGIPRHKDAAGFAVKVVITPKDPSAVMNAFRTAFGGPEPAGSVAVMFIKNWNASDEELVWHPIDEAGIPAQGTDDPSSIFVDHVVVRYNGQVFDPSYGAIYDTGDKFEAFETAALEYLGVVKGENGAIASEWAGIPNSSARETKETPPEPNP